MTNEEAKVKFDINKKYVHTFKLQDYMMDAFYVSCPAGTPFAFNPENRAEIKDMELFVKSCQYLLDEGLIEEMKEEKL